MGVGEYRASPPSGLRFNPKGYQLGVELLCYWEGMTRQKNAVLLEGDFKSPPAEHNPARGYSAGLERKKKMFPAPAPAGAPA